MLSKLKYFSMFLNFDAYALQIHVAGRKGKASARTRTAGREQQNSSKKKKNEKLQEAKWQGGSNANLNAWTNDGVRMGLNAEQNALNSVPAGTPTGEWQENLNRRRRAAGLPVKGEGSSSWCSDC